MANVKISDMTPGSALTGTELLEMVQSGATASTTSEALTYDLRSYGDFYSGADQTGSAATPTATIFGTTEIGSAGITVVTDGSALTRVTFATAGVYQIIASLQLTNAGASDHDCTMWLRKNGTDIVGSATKVTVPKTGDGGQGFMSQCHFETVTAGQYIQVMWLPEHADVTLNATAAVVGPPAVPLIPSAHMTAERIG